MTAKQRVSEDNAEAVRGGYAYVRQAMQSTRGHHSIHAEGTRRMILCGCAKGPFPAAPSPLARGRRKDYRWADAARRLKARK